jgi:hypothetical protein
MEAMRIGGTEKRLDDLNGRIAEDIRRIDERFVGIDERFIAMHRLMIQSLSVWGPECSPALVRLAA